MMGKIGFFIQSTSWGGLEMNTVKLAGLLKKKKYQVTLIGHPQSRIYQEGKDSFLSFHLIPRAAKYFDLKSALKISKILKADDISTVFVFDNKDLDVIVLAKKLFLKNLKIIYQQHMQMVINKKDMIHTWRFNGIDFWISPLDGLKKEVLQRTYYPEERIVVIPLGVDVPKFIKSKYTRKEAQKKLGIAPKSPLIGILGRITEKKGQFFLAQAVKILREKGILVELLICGAPTLNEPPDYLQKMKQYVADNDLGAVVHFRDYTKEVELFFNAIDIFTLASERETYGMVTIEAMLSGLPVIATSAGGTSEILGFGKFGLLYEYNNLDDYGQKVQWMLKHKKERSRMAEDAQKNAMENYSQDYEVEQILELLKKSR